MTAKGGSRAVVIVLALALAIARGAAAEGAPKLEDARDAYWKLDYETAKTLAEEVLATRGLGHVELVEASKIDALSLAALGREEAARDAFVALLECNPQYELDPKLGPRFRTPYFEARDYWRAQGTTPAIGVAYRSEDRSLRVDVQDPRGIVARVRVGARAHPGDAFATADGARGASLVIAADVEAVEYYAQALNARDQAVLEFGSAAQPKSLVIPARIVVAPRAELPRETPREAPVERGPAPDEPRRSIVASPWFWAGVGIVVTGLAVGGYFALRSHDSGEIVARPELRCGTQGDPCR